MHVSNFFTYNDSVVVSNFFMNNYRITVVRIAATMKLKRAYMTISYLMVTKDHLASIYICIRSVQLPYTRSLRFFSLFPKPLL